jgi:DNA-directed RNA polymerase sigma subunit (sigma70/sigma32)
MAGSLDFMGGEGPEEGPEEWPSDDGWPYRDAVTGADASDHDADVDDDLVALHALAPHLLDGLSALERDVIAARFGLDGRPARSMKQLQLDLGVPRSDLRVALGAGLAKVRAHLAP